MDKHLKAINDMRDIQSQKGNYDYSDYMRGLYVGLELASATLEEREPKYFPDWVGKEIKSIDISKQAYNEEEQAYIIRCKYCQLRDIYTKTEVKGGVIICPSCKKEMVVIGDE